MSPRQALFVAGVLALLLCSGPAAARDAASAAGAIANGEPRVRASLIVDLDTSGERGNVGVLFELHPGWHLYWRNPGDSGLAPRFEWRAAQGVQIGEIGWPVPHAFREDLDLLTYGYEDEVLLAAPVRIGTPLPGATIGVVADVLVCESQCIPATLSLEAPLAPHPEATVRAEIQARFEQHAERVPPSAAERGVALSLDWPSAPPEAGARFEATLYVDRCPADFADCSAAGAAFFPDAHEAWIVESGEARARRGGGLRLGLVGEWQSGTPPIDETLRGVLVLGRGEQARAFDIAVAPSPTRANAVGAVPWTLLLQGLAFGFLGGLLLNLMPCVLPVLAIKVFALAELAQQSRREVWHQAAAYTAGILTTLLALAACVIGLRLTGTAVGWGFHLQEPIFVALMAAVLVVFALNLLGAFEIQSNTGRLGELGTATSGARRSFFDGLLAVVLATPCSAPFLGTAVGFAFASPAPVIIAIFLAIGLGLAGPFVAIAWVPGWSRFIPRAGAWMIELRRGLAFALLLTVVWLLWIVGRSAGTDAMAALLALLLCVAFLVWGFGVLQRVHGRASPPVLLLVVAVALFAGLDRIELRPDAAAEGKPPAAGTARPYDPSVLAETVAAGTPAFVYFTADWCLTCKVNERRVLADPRVRDALAEQGYAVFRADWTRRDDEIRQELARLGKAGVPVYALYSAGAPDTPRLLPELLSVDGFVQATRQVAKR